VNDQGKKYEKYVDTKNYMIDKAIESYFGTNNAIKIPPIIYQPNDNSDGIPIVPLPESFFSEKDYMISPTSSNKNTNVNQYINMKFLSNTNIDKTNDFDDLDSELDLSDAPQVAPETLNTEAQSTTEVSSKNNEASNVVSNENDKQISAENDKQVSANPQINFVFNKNKNKQSTTSEPSKRDLLRKKLAEKKSSRSSGAKPINNALLQKNMANLMNMPGMNTIMENMMKGDNFKKLLQQIPPEKMNLDMPAFDPEQMKQFMQTISKK